MNNQKIVNLVRDCINNPGQMIQVEKDSGISCIAGFAIKTEFSIESFYLFVDEFYCPNKNGVPSEFKLAGVYVPENNTIYDANYVLTRATEKSNEFVNGGPFDLIRKNIYNNVAKLIIDKYSDKSVEELSELFDKATVLKAYERAEKFAFATFKMYKNRITDKGFSVSDFTDKMSDEIESNAFDEFVGIEDMLAISVKGKPADYLVDIFLNSHTGEKLITRLFDIKFRVETFNSIFNDKNHKFNTYLEISNALTGKETVLVYLSTNYESIDMRFPTRAFCFEDDIINSWCLPSNDMNKIEKVFVDHYIPLSYVKKIFYRGKVVWEAKK